MSKRAIMCWKNTGLHLFRKPELRLCYLLTVQLQASQVYLMYGFPNRQVNKTVWSRLLLTFLSNSKILWFDFSMRTWECRHLCLAYFFVTPTLFKDSWGEGRRNIMKRPENSLCISYLKYILFSSFSPVPLFLKSILTVLISLEKVGRQMGKWL